MNEQKFLLTVTKRLADWGDGIRVKLTKLFIVLYVSSVLSIGVVSVKAYQAGKELDNFKQRVQDQQEKQNQQIVTNTERLTDVERRISVEEQRQLDARVIHLESMAETQHELLITMAVGLGILIVETGLRLVLGANISYLRRKNKENGGD